MTREVPNADGLDAPNAEGGLFNPPPNRDDLFIVEVVLVVLNAPAPEDAGGVLVPPKVFPEDCWLVAAPNPEDCCCP